MYEGLDLGFLLKNFLMQTVSCGEARKQGDLR